MDRKDVCVVTNFLKVNAKSKGLVSDGYDALIWLLKKAGGRAHYADILREVKNPRKFGSWLVEPMRKLQEDKKDGRH